MKPLLRPSCTGAEMEAVHRVLESGWWGNGPVCAEFERRIAEHHAYKYAVTVNSATAGLHLALMANNIGKGDEVIVPALTFASTALAVSYTGAKPIFADVERRSLVLDIMDVRAKLTDRTKAVIPVDFAGLPFLDSEKLWGVTWIQDAAHNVGGYCYGDEVVFSFHPVKNLATGDGGAILTNDREKYERMKKLRWCGIDRSTFERLGKGYNWEYDIDEIGYKYHWNDIQASIGLVQLERLKYLNGYRRELVEIYREQLEGVEGVELPLDHPMHKYHLFYIRVEKNLRDGIIDYLRDNDISAGVHYKPLTHYSIYNQETPAVTEQEWQRLITLPLYFDRKESDVIEVCDVVKRAICQPTNT